jgi:hypothetical protein
MATLSIRARRTKTNRFPAAQGPLARWRKGSVHYALRADGSVVWRGVGRPTWNVVTLKGLPKMGVTAEQADEVLSANGYVKETSG